MASKKEQYQASQVKLARYAKAMSHPARLMILKFLEVTQSCTFGTLSAIVPISRASTAQHLTVLKSAKLVVCKSIPPHMYYSLNTRALEEAREIMGLFFSPITPKDYALATDYLSRQAPEFVGLVDMWITEERPSVVKHLVSLKERGLISSDADFKNLSDEELKAQVESIFHTYKK